MVRSNIQFLFTLTAVTLLVSVDAKAMTSGAANFCRATAEDFSVSRGVETEQLIEGFSKRDYRQSMLALERGANIGVLEKKDDFSRQVYSDFSLLRAAQKNSIQEIQSALQKGANPNASSERDAQFTPLMIASYCGYYDAVSYLIEHGANVNARGNMWLRSYVRGVTALHLSVVGRHFSILKKLLEKGANPNLFYQFDDAKKPERGIVPLMLANSSETVCLLLRFGADPNARDADGVSVIGLASIDDPELIKTLIGAGADVTLTADDGSSVLGYAPKISNLEVRNIILNYKKYEDKKECRPTKRKAN